MFGNPSYLNELQSIAKNNLILLEDNRIFWRYYT